MRGHLGPANRNGAGASDRVYAHGAISKPPGPLGSAIEFILANVLQLGPNAAAEFAACYGLGRHPEPGADRYGPEST